MLLHEGDYVGPYEIKQLIGQGGMATVYRAYHAQLDRDVAIKLMLQDYRDDAHFVARFEREARIVASLEHPHIVPVYDYSQHESNPYLVMKYIEGQTLKQRLLKRALPLDEILRLMTAIGDALTYAHERGVLHRDIKPSNIVIDMQETPYITDFGLARMVHLGESTLSVDMLLGTPHYISPEQARGEKDLDGRSDLYAFGVVLYELMVGHVPFTGDTPYAIIHDHIYTPLPLPSSLNTDIPEAVEAVLVKSLAKHRDERYGTANELIADLTQAIRRDSLHELDPSRVEKATTRFEEISSAAPLAQETSRSVAARHVLGSKTIDVSNEFDDVAPPLSATIKQSNKPNSRRFWQGIGCAGLLVSMLVIAMLMLRAMNNLVQLRDLDLDSGSIQATVVSRDDEPAYFSLNADLGFPTLDTSTLSLEDPRGQLAGVDSFVSYLVYAASYWQQGDVEQAQDSISDGLSAADDESIYLANASVLADQYDDVTSAVLYAVLSQMQPSENTDFSEHIHTYGTQYIYEHVAQADGIAASELLTLATELTDGQINIRGMLDSPLVHYVQALRFIDEGNYVLAGNAIDSLINSEDYPAEAQLLRADLLIMRGQNQRATPILQGILDDARAPQWVRTMAETHLKEIEVTS